MATYFFFGTYTTTSLKDISSRRTKQAASLIESMGGKVVEMHALIGDKDILIQVELPGNEEAMMTSVALTRATDIAFTTTPALPVDWFDTKAGTPKDKGSVRKKKR